MSYPWDELDMMGAGHEDRDWTGRALATAARACGPPLRQAEQMLPFLEGFLDEVETYGAAWSCGSSEEEQDEARWIETVTAQNLRTLEARHGHLLPVIASRRNDLKVAFPISVLTDMRHVDAFFVNGPVWIGRIRALVRWIRQRLAKLAGPVLAALRLVLARAVAALPARSPRAGVPQGPPARASPPGHPRSSRKRRVTLRPSTASRGERGEPHGSPPLTRSPLRSAA